MTQLRNSWYVGQTFLPDGETAVRYPVQIKRITTTGIADAVGVTTDLLAVAYSREDAQFIADAANHAKHRYGEQAMATNTKHTPGPKVQS